MGWNQIFRGTENYMCQMAWERGSGDECREGERWMLTTLGGMKVGCGWDWLRNGLDFISRIWDCISREPGEILSTIVIEWELSPTYQDSPKNSDFCESVQFGLVTQSYPTRCNPMDSSTPGFPLHHHLLELVQTHVHKVSDAIQPSQPLLSPSSPAFNLAQHHGLYQWVSSSHQVAKVLEFQLQH